MNRRLRQIPLAAALLTAALAAGCSDPGDIHRFDFPIMGTRARGRSTSGTGPRAPPRPARQGRVRQRGRAAERLATTRSWGASTRHRREASTPSRTCQHLPAGGRGRARGQRRGFRSGRGSADRGLGLPRGTARIPSESELADARALLRGYEHDPFRRTLTKTLDGARLDLGGVAKGYAVDRAVGDLIEFGTSSALIDLGGTVFAPGTARLAATPGAWGSATPSIRADLRHGGPGQPGRGHQRDLRALRGGGRAALRAHPRSVHGAAGRGAGRGHGDRADRDPGRCPVHRPVRVGPERARRLLHDTYPHVDALLSSRPTRRVGPGSRPPPGCAASSSCKPGCEGRFALEFMGVR